MNFALVRHLAAAAAATALLGAATVPAPVVALAHRLAHFEVTSSKTLRSYGVMGNATVAVRDDVLPASVEYAFQPSLSRAATLKYGVFQSARAARALFPPDFRSAEFPTVELVQPVPVAGKAKRGTCITYRGTGTELDDCATVVGRVHVMATLIQFNDWSHGADPRNAAAAQVLLQEGLDLIARVDVR